jgi:membrane associated rhomboid family serine protease
MKRLQHINTIIHFVIILWAVYFLSFFLPLQQFGIIPRTTIGLIGIPLSPFLHANIYHILTNSVGLLIFGCIFSLLEGRKTAMVISFIVILQGGLTWGFARPGNHIGASGMIFGLFGYLLLIGYFHRKVLYILISLAILFLYGSVIFGVFPTSRQISWEGHLFGFLAGAIAAKQKKLEKH